MVFKDNFIAVVKCNGKIMREFNGEVRLPFGSEYSILLKNKDSRKAVASVEIDGEDVMDGHRYIVPANSSVELRGFLKGMTAKNKFRFIKKTKEISKFRGDRLDDGLIRIEFWYEQKKDDPWLVYPTWHTFNINYDTKDISDWDGDSSYYVGGNTKGLSGGFSAGSPVATTFCSNMSQTISHPTPDDGITVKGSNVNQQFCYGNIGDLENNSSVIIIKLVGATKRNKKVVKVKKPITVKTRIQCPTCGKKWKSSMKFCGRCSTALT
jgi:hypothetical protein